MKIDYNVHPKFYNENQLKFLGDFGFEENLNSIKKNYKDSTKKKLIKSFDRIFESLISQVENDVDYTIFLKDLKMGSKIILERDLKYLKLVSKFKYDLINDEIHEFRIQDQIINKINKIAESHIHRFRKNVLESKLKRSDLSISSGHDIRKIIRILNKEFKNKNLLETASKIIGYDVEVSGCALELSSEKASWWKPVHLGVNSFPLTNYFHLDEGTDSIKGMIYLNDVDIENGNFSYVEKCFNIIEVSEFQKIIGRGIQFIGNHPKSLLNEKYNHVYHQVFGCEIFTKDFSRLPQEVKFNSHFGWDILPKSVLEKKIVENEKHLVGRKGTSIFFDGSRLLHRGGMVQKGERIALQLILEKKINFRLLKKAFFKILNYLK